MVFPTCYWELPNMILHALLLLGYVKQLISCAFNLLGLGDLIDDDSALLEPPAHVHAHHHHHHHHHHSVLSALIEDAMPALQFTELGGHADSCAVCLHEFEGLAEVRWLPNCRHVFHRCCIDPWIKHGQRACPLCRASLFPANGQPELDCTLSDAAGIATISEPFLADFPSSGSSPTPCFPTVCFLSSNVGEEDDVGMAFNVHRQ